MFALDLFYACPLFHGFFSEICNYLHPWRKVSMLHDPEPQIALNLVYILGG